MISRLTAGLQYPLSTLHERRCRRPCKTRFRLAGSAFTGRVLNPLGHDERFQVTSVLLSRAYPDASWAHVRRGFIDLAAKGASPIAAEVLKRIAALYRIEGEIAGLSAEARRQARGERSRPLLTTFELFLRDKLALLSQKSTLAVAIRYATSRWAGLTLYVDNGRVEMDSNTVERSIRPLALTRKNALFAGSDRGGQTWAVIASLVETCKLNGVDPQGYFADVISRIVGGHPQSQLDDLLPWAYPTIPGLRAAA